MLILKPTSTVKNRKNNYKGVLSYEKYEELLQDDEIEVNGCTLYRIKACKDFGNVKVGDLGGYIEEYENLSQEGNCWVYGFAQVSESAQVYGNAQVYGYAHAGENANIYDDAQVYGNACICDNADIVSCYVL